MSDVDAAAAVQEEVAALTRAAVLDVELLDGGASRSGWRMRLSPAAGDGPHDVYVRMGAAETGAVAREYNVVREAEIVRDVAAAGVPAPKVFAISESLPLAVMQFIRGTSDFERIQALKTRRSVRRQYLNALRALHALEVGQVGALDGDQADTIGDATARDVEDWQRLAGQDGVGADPLLALAGQWLRRNVTGGHDRARVVHGDAGPGNFMFHNGHVTALVDWELAHVGDPVEDLGWILLRVGDAPLDEARAWVAGFARVNRISIRDDAVHFHRILALYKTTVAISSSVKNRKPGLSSHLMQLLNLYRYQLGRLLADALAVPRPADELITEIPSLGSSVAELAVDGGNLLERVLLAGHLDAGSKASVRRARLILGFFARREVIWPTASVEICTQASALLGTTPESVEQMLLELRPYADLDTGADVARALRLLLDLEWRRMSLWPGLQRRATASCRRTGELTGRAAP